MITRNSIYGTPWIDMENPTAEDIHAIINEFGIDESCAVELMHPSLRTKVDRYDHFLFLVLHFPDHPAHNTTGTIEIDFVVHKDYLITVRYGHVDTLMVFEKKHALANKSTPTPTHGGTVFAMILSELYHGLTEELSLIKKDINRVEVQIFAQTDAHISKKLLVIHRKLLDCRSALRFHTDVLASYETESLKLFGKSYEDSLRVINNAYYRMTTLLDTSREINHELRETYDALLTHTTNKVMKTLTLMSFITFPLTLLVAVATFPGAPSSWHTEHGFYILIATIIMIGAILILFFRKKDWL